MLSLSPIKYLNIWSPDPMSTANDSSFPPRFGPANYSAEVYIYSTVYIVKSSMNIYLNMCSIMFVVQLPQCWWLIWPFNFIIYAETVLYSVYLSPSVSDRIRPALETRSQNSQRRWCQNNLTLYYLKYFKLAIIIYV